MGKSRKKAIVLLSGGLDSATVLAFSLKMGYEPCTMTFLYGQRHKIELESAMKIADFFGVKEKKVIEIAPGIFMGSALTGNLDVPKNRADRDISSGIPVTYVPARNTIFLSYALAWAEVLGSDDIFIGVNAVDYSGYPDCRSEFIEAYERMANLATSRSVEGRHVTIHNPLQFMGKGEIIRAGMEIGVDYSLTHSCYDPDVEGNPCGQCDSCILRKKGFSEAGIHDPAL